MIMKDIMNGLSMLKDKELNFATISLGSIILHKG